MRALAGALAVLAALAAGCHNIPPPASAMPSADDAIARLRATGACGRGVQASATIDHFGDQGRVRADLSLFALVPARLRMDVTSSFGAVLATLTSDGERFALRDLREKRFLVGPASTCNIARLTTVPIPGHALVALLRGQAPILKHTPDATSITWDRGGFYVLTLPSTRDATEELHLAPYAADFARPWNEQRMRLLQVVVRQYGGVAYKAELDDHSPAKMAKERVDPDGIDAPLPPSGPPCTADVPRKIHMSVPDQNEDVILRYGDVQWNPPVPEGTFTQPPPSDMQLIPIDCTD